MEFSFWYLLAIFQVVWGIYACRWVYRLFHGDLDYILKEDEEYAKQFTAFRRNDILNWNKFELVFGAVFLLPYRFVFSMLSLVVCGILCGVLTIGQDLKKEIPAWRKFLIRGVTQSLPRLMLYLFGIYRIERKYHKITDYDPTYPKEFLDRKPPTTVPIAVSNHISFLDIFYFMICRHYPCFLAMKEVASWPIVGWIATVRQAVFVNREDRTAKDAVIEVIKTRVRDIQSGRKFPPMIIFPEGTTSNGQAVMVFKKGA
eukprot:CAMPEP_0176458272 /NCGR_PEP_ID=MMETSP0127-20121128/32489_1 /TAXON_ID=938130 /ORGANISM="Platyophrya macrostoma, Strain WH" /LENGTH=257 /DNA_ID=CAMNT_0017848799 /DNA_START=25 /DNA_END=794 /DNA_ORIENTATION=+